MVKVAPSAEPMSISALSQEALGGGYAGPETALESEGPLKGKKVVLG